MFSENRYNDFHKILWIYSAFEPQQYDSIGYSRKILQTKEKYFLIFYLSPKLQPKPTDQSCSNSIFRVLLQLSPVRPFHFRPTFNIKGTLMLRVFHIRNKKRSDKHGILQTWSIVFVAMLLNQQEDRQESIVINHLKSNAYRNKCL